MDGPRPREGRSHTAFTLVELLIVLGILALLAAILLPVVAWSRERGRRATCQQQLRQMAMALKMYADESDGAFPPADSWSAAVLRTLHVQPPFYCPDTLSFIPGSQVTGPPAYATAGYAYNSLLAGFPYDPRSGLPRPLGQAAVRFPSTTVAICDCRLQIFSLDAPDVDQKGAAPWGEQGGLRHQGGANYAFVDGHVRWLRPEQVGAGGDPASQDGSKPSFQP